MRRITLKYAQPGMILGMPVYDNYGKELLGRRTNLTDLHLSIMHRNSVSEILIEDQRVDDLLVASMISPEREGKLADAFRFMLDGAKSAGSLDSSALSAVNVAVGEIARSLALSIMGEINVACSVTQVDYPYLLPVKSAMLAMALGYKLGRTTDELTILGMSSLLKDISSIFLPPDILNESVLDEEETRLVHSHPGRSYELLSKYNDIKEAIPNVVIQHHEQWSGTGYPRGLKGTQISPYAQIIAVADIFSDLLVERPGKQKCMTHEAIEYIMAASGDLFDPALVESFVRKIPAYPNGLTVKLNSGEIGIVSDPNLGFIARPVIRVTFELERGVLKKPYDMNLAKSEYQRKLISKVLEYD
jgi:HD-GYP domain-containing protein (c-di-GMP phosphodiesterase class II)